MYEGERDFNFNVNENIPRKWKVGSRFFPKPRDRLITNPGLQFPLATFPTPFRRKNIDADKNTSRQIAAGADLRPTVLLRPHPLARGCVQSASSREWGKLRRAPARLALRYKRTDT